MKKFTFVVLPVLILVVALFGYIIMNGNQSIGIIKNNMLTLLGTPADFTPDCDAYRIFNGGMVGEHGVAKTEGFYSGSYYNQLAPNEKAIYDSIKNSDVSEKNVVAKLPEPIFFYSHTSSPSEDELVGVNAYIADTYQRALDALAMDGSDGFYIKLGKGGSLCRFEYTNVHNGEQTVWRIDSVKTDIVIKECYQDNPGQAVSLVEKVASDFIPSGNTRYERVKSIHDYVVNHGSYKHTSFSDDAYGLLVDKRAVCAGFSKAFKLLCDKNNIPCALVAGTGVTDSESGEHMWCLVQMEDGMWYGVDPTWDDYGGDEYFLVGGNTVSSFSGRTFDQAHIPTGDFTNYGYKPFVYPSLSDKEYLK